MEKKTECEIVQDLLLGYMDGVLNTESKKLVEKHLVECKQCQEKLGEIEKEGKENEDNQKVQIDYLKKLRRKNRIKSVLLAGLILVAIFASWYLRKFFIINGVCRKIEKQFESENFYVETITSNSEESVTVCKTWYKDGKYKIMLYIETEEGIVQKFETQYGNVFENAKESYFVNEEEKSVRKETMLFENQKSHLIPATNPFALKYMDKYMLFRLGAPFYVKISTDHKEIGRKYYVFDLGETKKWVDMDSGLPIMSFGDVVSRTYYKDTKIPKQKFENISEYHYEFGKVTDEEVDMPSLEEYQFTEFDWKEEVEKR